MRTVWCLIALCVSVILSVTPALGQLTVDATRPTRQRRREPISGSGGSFSRKLPLEVRIETDGAPPDENGKTVVRFILTNSGKNDVAVPVSPNPGDFEPEDSEVGYAVKMLHLYVTSDRGGGVNRQRAVLPGGAFLYGQSAFPGSLVSLAPRESLQVLARVSLPADTEVEEGGRVLVGRVSVNEETVKTVGGKTSSDTQEIGSANSQDYTVHSFLQRHE